MTIVSTPDTRNASSSSLSSSSFGHKMLTKMGWSSGQGLGKTKQGTKHHLRAVRREENLGIGAQTDTYGSGGWDETSKNFHGVLASLKEEHGGSSAPSSDDDEKKRKKKDSSSSSSKKKKKKKRMLEKQESGLTLARNKVTAGHARKMREAKDLGNKSREDMAAIFGVKVEQLPSSGTVSSSATGAADGGDISAEGSPNDAEQSSASAPGDSASSDCSGSSGEDKKAQKKKKRKSERKEKKEKKRKRSSGESKRPKKSRRE